jgi:hypothetical protein
VLVFTDPDEDWGWCLYETGFFDGLSHLSDTKQRRICCLHHESAAPPSPIADLQTVRANEDDVKKWLLELFEHTQQEGAQFVSIPDLAKQICMLFAIEQKPVYSQQLIRITIDCSLTSPDDLPGNTKIKGNERTMLELFNIYKEKTDWETIKGQFDANPNTSEANASTLKEISRAIYAVCHHNPVRPVQGIIFAAQEPKRYRPVINRAKQVSKSLIDCEVLLIEEAGGALQNVDKPLGALLTATRMAARIRWEIVRKFTPAVVSSKASIEPYKLRYDLQTNLNNVFMEAEFRGNFSPIDVLEAFEDDSEKEKIQTMIAQWSKIYPEIWKSIGFPDVRETFGEVSRSEMTDEDIALLKRRLQDLAEMNRDFLGMAVRRMEILIQRELGFSKANATLNSRTETATTQHRKVRARPRTKPCLAIAAAS